MKVFLCASLAATDHTQSNDLWRKNFAPRDNQINSLCHFRLLCAACDSYRNRVLSLYLHKNILHTLDGTNKHSHSQFIYLIFLCDWLNLRDIAIGFIVLDALVVAFIIHNLCVLFRLQMVFWQSETGIW